MANDPSDTAESRSAVVRGSLEERPVPRLLYELFRKQVTGCLTIVDDCKDESSLYLRDGAPVHLERPNDIDRLDQVLIESGVLTGEVVRAVSDSLPAGKRLGEALLERGLIAEPALANVLKLQMRRKLTRLFFPNKGTFAVYVEPHAYGTGGEFGEMRIDPRCLIYPGIRAAYDEARLEAELAPLKSHRFRLVPTLTSSLLEAMGFGAQDPTVRALGERALSLADLPVPGAKAMDSKSVVIALLYTDLLDTAPLADDSTREVATPKNATGPVAVPARPAPQARPPDVIHRRATGVLPAENSGSASTGRPPGPTPRRGTGTFPAVNLGSAPPGAAPRTATGAFPAVNPGAHPPSTPRMGTAPFPAANPGSGHARPADATPRVGTAPFPAATVGSAPPGRTMEPARRGATGTFPVVNLGPGAAGRGAPGANKPGTGPHGTASPRSAEWNKTPSNSAAHATLGGRITELHEKLGTLSHFALLGISENASLPELGTAYLKNVRLFHPDRLPGLGLGHLVEKAARIVAQLNEAQSVLADPKRRAEYLAVRARPANSPIVDSGQSIVAAENSFQMGEVLLRKGDHARALDAFAEAMRANPLEPVYRAYWAWARWDIPGPQKDRLVRETLKILEDTAKERPRFPQGQYWIGLLHKHLGDLTSAASAFRAAVAQDPNLLDAERELRVIELRRSKATAAHPIPEKPSTASAARQKPGVINKILKR
jgi:tetratricopeptide (TPR) repeat protein